MTPRRPTELAQASLNISEAWNRYDAFCAAGDKIGAKCAWDALQMVEDIYNSLYHQWQILGGTSDIDSIAFPFVDYDSADADDHRRTIDDIMAGL